MGKGITPHYVQGRWQARATLLAAASSDTVGDWFLINGSRPWAITVVGDFDGSVRLRVANQEAEPTGAKTSYPLLDQDITTPYLINLDLPLMWVCAELTGNGSGTAQVDFMGG
jgi:hypothetical protein